MTKAKNKNHLRMTSRFRISDTTILIKPSIETSERILNISFLVFIKNDLKINNYA